MSENKQTQDIGEAELDGAGGSAKGQPQQGQSQGGTGGGKGDPNAPTPQEEKAAIEQDDGAVPSKGY